MAPPSNSCRRYVVHHHRGDMATFNLFPPAPSWTPPRLSGVLNANANGATLDAQGLLTGPIVEASPGRFQFPVAGGVAQTNPAQGAICVVPWRGPDGRISATLPKGLHLRATVHTAPAGSSGAVLVMGLATDDALTISAWAAMDWDGVNPRPRAGHTALFSVAGADTLGAGWEESFALRPAPAPITNIVDIGLIYASMVDPGGKRRAQIGRTLNQSLPSAPSRLFFGVFGSGVLAAMTPEFSVEYHYSPLADGERL